MARPSSETSVIYLVGMPGSGKSTLGRNLATLLNYSFLDLDYEIEKQANKTISSIFNDYGEDYFRLLEQKVVLETGEKAKLVIATGGGAPCYFSNMDFMNDNGITVFINVSAKELTNRILGNGQNKRPLLQNKTREELEKELEEKLESRSIFYNKANVIISNDFANAEDILSLIQSKNIKK